MVDEDAVRERLIKMMGNHWAVDRVENALGNPGFADLVYSCAGRRGFIECKHLNGSELLQPKVRVGLTREQADFLTRHGRECRFAYIVLGISDGRVFLYSYTMARVLLGTHRPADLIQMAWGPIRTPKELQLKLRGTTA